MAKEFRRYTDYDIESSRRRMDTTMTQLRRAKIKFDLKKWCDENYMGISHFAQTVSLNETLNAEPQCSGMRNMRTKLLMLDVGYEYITALKRRTNTSLYIAKSSDVQDIISYKFDWNVWNNIYDKDYNIEFDCVNGSGKQCRARVAVEHLEFDGIISVSIDSVCNFSKNTDLHKSNWLFCNYGTVLLMPDKKKIFIVSFDEKLGKETLVLSENYSVYGTSVDTDIYDMCNFDKCIGDSVEINTLTGVLIAQGALNKYLEVMTCTKKYKRVSTVEKHVESKKQSYKMSVCENDSYVPLSSYAVKIVRERKEWQGGHHASPRPHDVREHTRTYKSGKTITVKAFHKSSPKYAGPDRSKVIIVDK